MGIRRGAVRKAITINTEDWREISRICSCAGLRVSEFFSLVIRGVIRDCSGSCDSRDITEKLKERY